MAQTIEGEVHTQKSKTTIKLKKDLLYDMVEAYENIIYGDGKKLGMIQCLDPYYNGTWNENLEKTEKLKKELKNG